MEVLWINSVYFYKNSTSNGEAWKCEEVVEIKAEWLMLMTAQLKTGC